MVKNWVCTNIEQGYMQARLGYSVAQLGTTAPIDLEVGEGVPEMGLGFKS